MTQLWSNTIHSGFAYALRAHVRPSDWLLSTCALRSAASAECTRIISLLLSRGDDATSFAQLCVIIASMHKSVVFALHYDLREKGRTNQHAYVRVRRSLLLILSRPTPTYTRTGRSRALRLLIYRGSYTELYLPFLPGFVVNGNT